MRVWTAAGERTIPWDTALDSSAIERSDAEANRRIKTLRLCDVDGRTFRDRFTYRGESLWWFAELYLHKGRVLNRALQALAALEALADRESPVAWSVDEPDPIAAHVAAAVAARRGFAYRGPSGGRLARDVEGATKAFLHTFTAMADRFRPQGRPRPAVRPRVAVFVHAAFGRVEAGDETYVGPVLRALGARLPAEALHLVGVGPRTNFRARSWRQRWREFSDPQARGLPFTPVEAFSSWTDLQPSLAVYRARRATRRSLAASQALRDAAHVEGCDLLPLVGPELDGVADLQFPWSARAMDEAGAALDTLAPDVVVTYAEAGGWGRAIMLEARRRGIPSVGLQHGFIYRHWLNYLHEPDELAPSVANPSDRGFPRPDLTLVFDRFAAAHLVERGRFPAEAVEVAGSPRLDAIVASARAVDAASRARFRDELGAGDDDRVVVIAAKYTQIAGMMDALVAAAAVRPGVRLVVKPHPAERPDPYIAGARAATVRLAPAGTDLGALVAVADLLVTVNSTAAIEAMPLDVPALVVGLPNNLSPFVDAGAMAGVTVGADIGGVLDRLLYDQESRQQLAAARRAFMDRFDIRADGRSAERAADAILSLAGSRA